MTGKEAKSTKAAKQLEEDKQLFNFYDEQFSKILEKYGTIKKPIRNSRAWDIFTKKYFKD